MAVETDWSAHPTWAITIQDRMVGSINLMVTPAVSRAELSYSIARALWGQGLATEAARAVVSWAFDELRLAN